MTEPPHADPRTHRSDWDEGVASERTILSWERTGLSTIVVAVLVLRAGVVDGPLALAIPIGTLLALTGAAEWLFGARLAAEHERPFAAGAPLHERVFMAVGAVTLIAAAGAAALAIAE
jgi:uncharacterized membrane protein YidH (DUF202 family)